MSPAPLGYDIFCRVIDNYGDIGVCWRLARQLAGAPFHAPVRLWVDDLTAFARIEPGVSPDRNRQPLGGVDIIHWTADAPALTPHPVVIEAFACDPPDDFVRRMIAQDSLCINLEYLSAESWVESCHALPSLQSNGLRKSFFFPGFTPATGGLLREPGLIAARDAWLANPETRWNWLRTLGLGSGLIEGLQSGWRQVFLFGYPSAPVCALIEALARQPQATVVLRPRGMYPDLAEPLDAKVRVVEIPFVPQAEFDQLLWSSDLNFVRGEDSLVRAIWAGKPLVWQIYEQEENIHLDKLQAWLDRSPYSPAVHALMRAWNTADATATARHLDELLNPSAWAQWCVQAGRWSAELARQTDLATALTAFCANNRRKE